MEEKIGRKIFFVCEVASSPSGLLAKNRALVSIFTCNGSHPWLPLLSLHKIFVLLTFITLINTISKKTFITYKKQEVKFFVAKVIEARAGFYYRQILRLRLKF